ncbi:GIY-YIG nuclease family protein [Nostoc sp. CENA67]|uniref:GIY-YIG nuclease family protein n=1 Tax=Amazonocrinis nigriterrae CENA67 TaxID=2794033 RepID=A0A8J7HUC8_9NOST|nr:GIY-YIG nuclease family protein [Amazonocrinis nigriterrae]MBH8565902.1 GIY-YIG nuclease family protein [Amazonocrinis nigriterrae CENA67]
MLKINPLELPSVSFQERKILPASPGIYFAISSNDEILYIGRTSNLRNRWKSHHRAVQFKSQSQNIRLAWLQVDDETLLPEIEAALIEHFAPAFNNTHLPGGIIRLTVDLPESMHRKLSVLAAKTGRKKAEIIRLLLDEAFQDVEE